MQMRIGGLAFLLFCGTDAAEDLKSAEKALAQALKDQNLKGGETAVASLLTADSPDAMKILLAAASKPPAAKKDKDGADDTAAMECALTLLNGAASFSDPAALSALGDFILASKVKPIARDAMAAVCNHAKKALVPLCFKILEGGTDDLKLMAVDQIITLGDRTSVEPLVKAMKANEKNAGDLRIRIGRALTVLTCQDYGDSVSNWTG